MADSEIPEVFLKDPKFVICLKATLKTEVENNKLKIKDIKEQVEVTKRAVENKYSERKKLKELMQLQKEKATLLEPTLKRLTATYHEKQLDQKLKAAGVDRESQRIRDEKKQLQVILNNYEKTWGEYKAKYAKLEFAIKRREARNKLEKANIENKVSEFQRNRLLTMLEQRKKIDDARFKVMTVKMAMLVLKRWNQQGYIVNLKRKIEVSDTQYKQLCEQCNALHKKAEEEAKARELARRQMPAPRVDNSLLRSLYASTLRQSPRVPKLIRQPSIDSDLISVNSVLIQELCNEDNYTLKNRHHKHKEDIQSVGELSCCAISQDTNSKHPEKAQQVGQFEQIGEVEEPERNAKNYQNNDQDVEGLETVCRQLSIDDGSVCYGHDDDQSQEGPAGTTITVEATIEHHEYRLSHQSLSKLGKKASSFGHSDDPPAKKCKADVARKHALPRSKLPIPIDKIKQQESPKIKHQVSMSPKTNYHRASPQINQQLSPQIKPLLSFNKEMPKIKKVETIIPPIKLQVKPPMAEVPPTPANFYSNRQYAPSCASSDNMSAICDSDINWQNFSPPNQSVSNLSFASEASAFKSMMKNTSEVFANRQNNPAKPINQANININNNNNSRADFFAFGGGSNNPKTFF